MLKNWFRRATDGSCRVRAKTGLAIALGAPIALAPLFAAAAPVRVSFGDHAEFSRIAVRPGAIAVTAERDRAHCAVVLRGADAAWQGDLAAAGRLPSGRLADVKIDAAGRLVVSVPCTAEMRTRQEDGLLLFDISAGPGSLHLPPLPVRRPGPAGQPAVAVAAPAAVAAPVAAPESDVERIRAAVQRAVAAVDAAPLSQLPAAPVPAAAPAVAPTLAPVPEPEVGAVPPPSLAGVPALEPMAWRGLDYATGRLGLTGERSEAALIDAARFHLAWGEWGEAGDAAEAAAALDGPRHGEALLLQEAAALAADRMLPSPSILAAGPREHPDWPPFATLSWLAQGMPAVDRGDIARALDRIQAYGPALEAALLPRLTEAAIRGLDGTAARAALERLEPMVAQGRVDAAAVPYLRGLLALARREPDEATAAFAEAARSTGPWAARARLQTVEDGIGSGGMTPDAATDALDSLVADWRGGDIEIRAQHLRLDLAGRRGDAGQALSALSRLSRLAGDGAEAEGWRRRFEAALDTAYDRAERQDLPLAALVGIHTRYAAEGDPVALGPRTLRYAGILQAAGLSLAAQDAMRAAIALGTPDGATALAATALDRGDYTRAAHVLDGATGDAVPALRARALAGLDDRAGALKAIAGRQDAEASRARAGILFVGGDWAGAQAGFAAVEAAGGPLSPAERMRWAAAALRAGDAGTADALGQRLGGGAARLLSGVRGATPSIKADRKAGLAALQEAGRVLATFDDVFGPDKAGAADAGG
jgi:hypothetical protein